MSKPPCDRVTNLVEYFTKLVGNERHPKGDSYSSAIISFSGFPEHWFVTRSHDVLLDSGKTKAIRGINSKISTTKVTNNSSAPCVVVRIVAC